MKKAKIISSGKNKLKKKESIKKIEIYYKKSKYKLKIELDKSKEMIIFKLISKKSNYNFMENYKYEELINYFNLNKNEYTNLVKIYDDLKEFKILDKCDNFIKLKINDKYEITINNNNQESESNINLQNNDIMPNKEINNNESINLKNSVKSFYNIKKIFSFFDTNKKLTLIKYNKLYQKLFLIDIEYYKEISQKYIIFEQNGNGKEYNKYNIIN